jgi:hypothetical protein
VIVDHPMPSLVSLRDSAFGRVHRYGQSSKEWQVLQCRRAPPQIRSAGGILLAMAN